MTEDKDLKTCYCHADMVEIMKELTESQKKCVHFSFLYKVVIVIFAISGVAFGTIWAEKASTHTVKAQGARLIIAEMDVRASRDRTEKLFNMILAKLNK